MLGYYLKFNNASFPNPVSVTMNSKTLENVSQSESGTDLVCVVRPAKKSWLFSFNLTSRTKEILKGLCADEQTSMYYMGDTYTVRLRDFQEKLVQDSEWVDTSEGLYQVTVKATEF